ncbi:acyl-CoA dehydrogenase family protein [Streptomyces caniscabiei]|uniref:Acyl-CoA dehydrogenase family protein n=1 Tax=Streptomyces caniscabiei TaxID=2746961 RepID=A0ABU4MTM0_9ACTN|nr:acyl-CoA dehydrogenase family protein [Streptomyces caniscabiei]MBE4738285.1 acyl-CoA dehydrogenase family protein [Streptomyces caniscabiei]MBE4757047.1 acyl-CoA dehydrogenase family protein [Streptomyces caniscabiei]MBE4770299.1 acyl-CoA dehydrogenase family protein [Streptomyces caniscabiei]MBE4785443.1 acyl-CoA dehydrogenase family protein [Streptomyces caniscabiei]MBE4796785.1 acyl-CoA dehydrogenase family protein [Streptomyces caniscabiei]
MDLAYSAEEEAFRARLREWLAKTLPSLPPKPSPDDWPGRRAYDLGWQRTLYDAGYGEVHWDASPTTRLIFLEETERAGAPYVGAGFVGLLHAGPTIAAEGTAEQRARWLPPILRGEEVWCQGFSEPDAGSDLASLRTRARRDGDAYVVSGSKIWTSHAEVADWCELLVRTDGEAPKHRGISWLAMPMDAPGVTVRPLRTLAGSTEFAEVFLDDVRVPVANRVGAENDGWRVTMVTLSFERGTAFVGEVVACRRVLAEVAREARANGAWDDSGVRRRLGRSNAEFRALWRLTQWNVSEGEASGGVRGATGGVPGVGGSVFKLRYSRARQELFELAAEVLGPDALDLGRGWVLDRLSSLSYTIAAGTSEIQRNIVGERILGLPKG